MPAARLLPNSHDRGIAIGEERGIAIGKERKNLKDITRLRSKGYDDTAIADLLDLSLDYVQQH